jgi:co-chaperonin GroES (HSP10)
MAKVESESKGGILLTDTTRRKALIRATVVRVGSGEKVDKIGLSKGDTVVFDQYKYYGQIVDSSNEALRVIDIDDVDIILHEE